MPQANSDDARQFQRTLLALALLVRVMGLILGDFYRAQARRKQP